MSEAVLSTILGASIPTVATAVTTIFLARMAIRNSAKSDILQMILEDKMAVIEGHLPTNYQNVLTAYDRYHKHGGDSYITDKTEEYKRWFVFIEAEKLNKGA